MAGKYTKYTSNYIKKSKHQNVYNGSIFERNWVTTGGKINFGKDKKPYYADSGFIFTTSNVPTFQKKLKIYNNTNVWKYDDVKDANALTNKIAIQEKSNDLRDFAYYGSCVNLIQGSIENIIKEFPASIYTTKYYFEIPPLDKTKSFITLDEYIIDNSFEIDLYNKNVALTDFDNPMRYMYCSNRKYTINGENITSYEIETDFDNECPMYNQYDWKYEHNDGDATVIKVTINGTYVLNGYKVNDKIVFTCKDIITIRPNDDVLSEYFNNLSGFEKVLLNYNSKPLYTNRFITPIENNLGWTYAEKTYTWPKKDDYCIDINSTNYSDFINRIYDMAQKMDDLWTDNVYRNMTHEAIKNFDWTYQREYISGEEEDNVEGGERMMNILRFCGRVFDDVKAYADGIGLINKITYDGYSNIPNAKLKDKLSIQGWEVYSIIPNVDSVNSYTVDETFLNSQIITKSSGWVSNDSKVNYRWYPTVNYETQTVSNFDNDFMRRLILSSSVIFKSKGTIESIRMIMAMFGFTDENEQDFSLKEDYYKVNANNDYNEKIISLNDKRKYTINYDENDPYWGIPVKNIFFSSDNSTFALPFFKEDNDKTNFYYQSKGGWGVFHNENINLAESTQNVSPIEYSETLSYLRMCSNVSDLLSIGQNNLKDGDIVYVYDLTDYIENGGEENVTPSHYFKVKDYLETDYLRGWIMIDIADGSDDAKKAKYLDNIVTNMLGNNPHSGYGNYDCGYNYINGLLKPFSNIESSNLSDDEINSVQFEAVQMPDSDKIKILGKICEEKNKSVLLKQSSVINNDSVDNYFLNSKILFMKNNTKGDENGLYKTYFKSVMLPYIMQVIPSTTILVLQDF